MRDYEQRVSALRIAVHAVDGLSVQPRAAVASPPDVLARRDALRQEIETLNAQLLALASDVMDVERAVDMASALPDL